MNLMEQLPAHVLDDATRPLHRMETEIVVLEVYGGATELRFPLLFMVSAESVPGCRQAIS
ncbi:MAG TPA: hypothetical protein VME67_14455 [Mycobacterium sp.]|nr:hypothetical protein [Mycobacterium sp.]HTX95947.1 hypothetical protein [Mycobacterium sp.]